MLPISLWHLQNCYYPMKSVLVNLYQVCRVIIRNLTVTWCHRPVDNEQNKSRETADANIAHELEPKKNEYLVLAGGQNVIQIFSNLRVSTFRKIWRPVQIGSFWPKIEVFYRSEWTKGGTTWKQFWIFSNSEMNVTVWAGKVDEKWGDLSGFDVSIWSYGLQIVWKKVVFAILCWPQQDI